MSEEVRLESAAIFRTSKSVHQNLHLSCVALAGAADEENAHVEKILPTLHGFQSQEALQPLSNFVQASQDAPYRFRQALFIAFVSSRIRYVTSIKLEGFSPTSSCRPRS
jgi:hypothetical protein